MKSAASITRTFAQQTLRHRTLPSTAQCTRTLASPLRFSASRSRTPLLTATDLTSRSFSMTSSAGKDASQGTLGVPQGQWKNTEISAIRFGPGCLKQALDKALTEDVPDRRRALVLTGKSLNTKTDVVEKVKAALGDRYIATFDEIGQHAPVDAIERCAGLAEKEKIDVLISVGGGSPIDSAKAVSHMLHEKQFGSAKEAGGRSRDDPSSFLPSIAVPTTLSVAETTQNAGFTSREGNKVGVSHPALVPRVIILDAELTLSTPERLWLSSGMRAVDHAIEGLYRPDFNWVLKNQYLGAIRELFPLLRLSKQNPQDINVRQRLQLAVTSSLFPEARQGALGLSHGLGHALGATYQIGHGITSCLTLAAAIRSTALAETTKPEQLATLSDALAYASPQDAPLNPNPVGIASSTSIDVHTCRERGTLLAQRVNDLVHDLGLATSLRECKVPESDYPKIAQHVSRGDEALQKRVMDLLNSITEPVSRGGLGAGK